MKCRKGSASDVLYAALTRALRAPRAPRGSKWQSHHRAVPFGGEMLERCVQEGGQCWRGCLQVSLQRYLLRVCPLTRSPSQEVQEERAVRAILVQLGCKVSCRRFAPDCVPKPPPEPPRGLQNGSQNEPKSSKMGSLGESWGHLWPTWVPKRLLERQVGAKMGQVGAKMGQDEVKLGPSWRPMGQISSSSLHLLS